jgi:hypothetical protein
VELLAVASMHGECVIDELERMWNDVVDAYLKLFPQRFPGGPGENYGKPRQYT